MMLGWRRGHSVGRYVIIDPSFPWPALGPGRQAMRIYAERQNRARIALADEGPMRMPWWGLSCAVRESGAILLNVWPGGKHGAPRPWAGTDVVWRPVLAELARFMAADLKCEVRLNWMPGGQPFEKQLTAPSLQGVKGFYCWRKGEQEPKAHVMRGLIRDGILAGRAHAPGLNAGVN